MLPAATRKRLRCIVVFAWYCELIGVVVVYFEGEKLGMVGKSLISMIQLFNSSLLPYDVRTSDSMETKAVVQSATSTMERISGHKGLERLGGFIVRPR